MSAKDLATADKEKKGNHLHTCMESRRSFTPMVYSTDGIPVTEALAAQQHLSSLLGYKLNWEYWEMCGFVRDQMSLAIVISNTLLLHGSREKEAYIQKKPNLEDEAMMALPAPWQG